MINKDYDLDITRDAMKFMAMYDSTQGSLKWSSNVRDGGCRDGGKILCNKCPLKHDVQERGRDKILYENMPKPKRRHQKTCKNKYN